MKKTTLKFQGAIDGREEYVIEVTAIDLSSQIHYFVKKIKE
jgi:hypothetical protein